MGGNPSWEELLVSKGCGAVLEESEEASLQLDKIKGKSRRKIIRIFRLAFIKDTFLYSLIAVLFLK